MRAWLLLSLVAFVGCRTKSATVKPEPSSVRAAATTSAPPPTKAHATSADPLLAMRLDGGRVAIFLEPEESRDVGDAGALTIYAKDPMIAIGVPFDARSLSAEARTHVDDTYTIHDDHGHACDGTADGFAVLHRMPAEDPTANRDTSGGETDSAWAARVFGNADKPSRVALVRTTGCGNVLWAAPKSQAQPTPLAVKNATKDVAARTRAVVVKHEGYADLKNKKATFEVSTLGDTLVWLRAKDPEYAGMTACFVVTQEPKPRVIASTPVCPPGVLDASQSASTTFVWFDNAVGTVKNDTLDVTYFPTAYFGLAEGF